jgi:hypothetical protein
MTWRSAALWTASLTMILTLHACSDGNGDDGPDGPDYDPVLPTSWAAAVTNSYFPLAPGTVWEYASDTVDGLETTRVEVLGTTRTVNGVTATVVRDRVFLDGELIEDTDDWYAQDAAGNVWYLGEATKDYEDGVLVGTEGSWEWGVDGALPGIIMWADPAAHAGEEYRQEFYEGEAEDWAEVEAVNESVTVPYGTATAVLRTHEWNGLESGSDERKYYGPGVGLVLEVAGDGGRVELIRLTRPS